MTRSTVLGGAVCTLAWATALPTALAGVAHGGLALDTPRSAWLAVLLVSLLTVLALAVVALAGAPPRSAPQLVLAGIVCGIAWGAAMRAFMAMAAGPASTFSWLGTFGFILPLSAIVGGLLGWAEHRRRRGLPTRRLTLAPLVFALDPSALLAVLPAMAGGWALAGRGTPRRRTVALVVACLPVPAFLLALALLDDIRRLAVPAEAANAVLLFSCLAVLTLACSIPFRAAPDGDGGTGLTDAARHGARTRFTVRGRG